MAQIKDWYNILDEILQCPVCLDVAKIKIYQCKSGHHICHLCRSKLEICPMCKNGFIKTRNLFVEDLISRLADIQVSIDRELEATLTKRQTQEKSRSTQTDFVEKEKVKVSSCTQTDGPIRREFVGKTGASFSCLIDSCELSFPYMPLVQHLRECHGQVFCEVRERNVLSQKFIIDTNIFPNRHDFVLHVRNVGVFFLIVLLRTKTNMQAKAVFINNDVLSIKKFLCELKLENKYHMQKMHRKITLRQPGPASFYNCNFFLEQEDARKLLNGNSMGCTFTITRQNNEV